MDAFEHITSERFIHDDLVRDAARGVDTLYEQWKQDGRITPFFLTWPAEAVPDESGTMVNDVCRLQLPENRTRWPELMREAIILTKAYAILLCEQRKSDVQVILESQHGTRCWTVPIEDHGDVHVLGKSSHRDNVENVGLLWRPDQASA